MLAMPNATMLARAEIWIFNIGLLLSASALIELDDAAGVSWCGSLPSDGDLSRPTAH